jgi:hypothetical protein
LQGSAGSAFRRSASVTWRVRVVYRSEDGGSTWSLVSKGTRDLRDVVFVSSRIAFLEDHGPPPPDDGQKHPAPPTHLLRSDDGGKSWSRTGADIGRVLQITAFDERHWWLFTEAGCSSVDVCKDRIWRTVDAGKHWDLIRLQAMPEGPVSFVSPTLGFAGSGYRTSDGGVTWSYVYPG